MTLQAVNNAPGNYGVSGSDTCAPPFWFETEFGLMRRAGQAKHPHSGLRSRQ